MVGFLDAGEEGGVGVPPVGDAGFAIPVVRDGERDTLEAFWGGAGDAAVFEDELTKAALNIYAEVFEVALVHPVYGALEEASFGPGGEFVLEGVDFVSAPAEVSFVKLGVIYVASEAGEFPDDEPGNGEAVAEVVHHFVELVTTGGGGGGDAVVVEAVEGEGVFDGPLAEFFFLLGDGEFLVFVAGVAEVGGDGGAGGEGMIICQFVICNIKLLSFNLGTRRLLTNLLRVPEW